MDRDDHYLVHHQSRCKRPKVVGPAPMVDGRIVPSTTHRYIEQELNYTPINGPDSSAHCSRTVCVARPPDHGLMRRTVYNSYGVYD